MGQIVLPASGSVYIDASAVIYFVEKVEPYLSASAPLWHALNAGTRPVVTSELTLLEVLVKPKREGNLALVDLFRDLLLRTIGLTCSPISRTVLEVAAELRARHALRTPDAIHAATALSENCALFVSNDVVFRRVSGLNVAVLSEIVAGP